MTMRKITPKKVYYWLQRKVVNIYDANIDRRITGRSLVKYVPSTDRNDEEGIGRTGSQSTPYMVLKRIFSHVELTENDSFLDVGCGKGRVLAYLVKIKAPCHITGIEISDEAGAVASEWSDLYDQVTVIRGDAFSLNYNDYNVFFFGRPFFPKTFLQFIEKFEKDVRHPITLLYWVDQQSGGYLKNRPGWTMTHREKIFKIHGLMMAGTPQGFSVWRYEPTKEPEAPIDWE